MRLVAPWHVEYSQTRDRTQVPCFGRWALHCWTIREDHFCSFPRLNSLLINGSLQSMPKLLCISHLKQYKEKPSWTLSALQLPLIFSTPFLCFQISSLFNPFTLCGLLTSPLYWSCSCHGHACFPCCQIQQSVFCSYLRCLSNSQPRSLLHLA